MNTKFDLYNCVWIHKEKRTRYVIIYTGKVQIEGHWFECITYVGEDKIYYTRTKENFFKAFEKE